MHINLQPVGQNIHPVSRQFLKNMGIVIIVLFLVCLFIIKSTSFKCKNCGCKLKNPKIEEETGDNIYTCPKCGKKYRVRG